MFRQRFNVVDDPGGSMTDIAAESGNSGASMFQPRQQTYDLRVARLRLRSVCGIFLLIALSSVEVTAERIYPGIGVMVHADRSIPVGE